MPHKPPLVVVYAGGNDIDAGIPLTVAADFKMLTTRIWSRLPETSIAYISIAPNPARWSQVDRVREANRLIAAYCHGDRPGSGSLRSFPGCWALDGKPRQELFVEDGLHMNRKGYEVWIPLVGDLLDAVVPPQAPRTRMAQRGRLGVSPHRRRPIAVGRCRARRDRGGRARDGRRVAGRAGPLAQPAHQRGITDREQTVAVVALPGLH